MSTTIGVQAYPLQWPAGRPRTPAYRRTRARFDTTFAVARDELYRELRRLGAKAVVLSTNVELRQDGIPYANRRQPDDVGVAAYFTYKGRQTCFACDRWDKIEDNIRGVCKTIEAIRGIARWGSGDMIDAAFSGFAALPASSMTQRRWHEVLGVPPNADAPTVSAAYRRLSLERHPDRAGSNEAQAELNAARDAYVRERGVQIG